MVQMDFLASNHVRIVGLCQFVHRTDIFLVSFPIVIVIDHVALAAGRHAGGWAAGVR